MRWMIRWYSLTEFHCFFEKESDLTEQADSALAVWNTVRVKNL
jgi:hypothetical protein